MTTRRGPGKSETPIARMGNYYEVRRADMPVYYVVIGDLRFAPCIYIFQALSSPNLRLTFTCHLRPVSATLGW